MADQPDLTKELTPEGFAHHAEDITADREPYGPPGLRGLVQNPFVLMCAACSTLGGLYVLTKMHSTDCKSTLPMKAANQNQAIRI